jgi:flagellar protein FlaI
MHGPPLSIVELIRRGTLDAELAALLWLLVEARLPVIVGATPQRAGKTTLLVALLDFLPPGAQVVTLGGFEETFDWLPEARPVSLHI